LSKEFAAEVPELEFSPAEILLFLEAKSKPPRISEDAKPKDT
jgi:hypothetical protein